MTQDEVGKLLDRLAQIFPSTTQGQLEILSQYFLKCPRWEPVDEAISRYAKTNDTLVIPRFLEIVRDCLPYPGSTLRETREAERLKEQDEARVSAALGKMSPEELRALKEQYLAEAPPQMRKYLTKLDPNSSPMLRSILYERIRKGEGR